jgi:hypothetical protein
MDKRFAALSIVVMLITTIALAYFAYRGPLARYTQAASTVASREKSIILAYPLTVKVVGELAGQVGYGFERRLVYQDELKTADEVFITSSFKDIVPVVKIDDFSIGSGGVGSVTKDLMARFAKTINT